MYSVLNTKWSYVAGFAVFEIESLVCALAPNSASLIIGRAVAGAGTGGVLFGSYVITAQTVPMRIRPAYTAAVAIMFSLGAIVAPLIGECFPCLGPARYVLIEFFVGQEPPSLSMRAGGGAFTSIFQLGVQYWWE